MADPKDKEEDDGYIADLLPDVEYEDYSGEQKGAATKKAPAKKTDDK